MQPERPTIAQPDGPPLRSNARREVIRLSGSQNLKGVILSAEWWSCVIHYNTFKKRSQPCLTDKGECAGCFGKMPKSKKWYLNLLSPEKGNCWVEVPEDSAASIRDYLSAYKSFRGLDSRIYRSKANNGVVRLELLSREPIADKRLPHAETPIEWLWKMWLHGRDLSEFTVQASQS